MRFDPCLVQSQLIQLLLGRLRKRKRLRHRIRQSQKRAHRFHHRKHRLSSPRLGFQNRAALFSALNNRPSSPLQLRNGNPTRIHQLNRPRAQLIHPRRIQQWIRVLPKQPSTNNQNQCPYSGSWLLAPGYFRGCTGYWLLATGYSLQSFSSFSKWSVTVPTGNVMRSWICTGSRRASSVSHTKTRPLRL